MKNYKAWVKEQGRKFLEEVGATFDADGGEHGGKSERPDFTAWADAHDHFVRFAAAQAESWSLADVNLVNHHSLEARKQLSAFGVCQQQRQALWRSQHHMRRIKPLALLAVRRRVAAARFDTQI